MAYSAVTVFYYVNVHMPAVFNLLVTISQKCKRMCRFDKTRGKKRFWKGLSHTGLSSLMLASPRLRVVLQVIWRCP